MAEERNFSYLPNPRVWKAFSAARIGCGDLEVRGAACGALVDWLRDFDARPLSEVSAEECAAAERMGRIGFKGRRLYKTDAFLELSRSGQSWRLSARAARSASLNPTASCVRSPAQRRGGPRSVRGDAVRQLSECPSGVRLRRADLPPRHARLRTRSGRPRSRRRGVHDLHDQDRPGLGLGPPRAFRRRGQFGRHLLPCELALFCNELCRSEALIALDKMLFLGNAEERFPRAMVHFDRFAHDPVFTPEFGPYLAKFATKCGVCRGR